MNTSSDDHTAGIAPSMADAPAYQAVAAPPVDSRWNPIHGAPGETRLIRPAVDNMLHFPPDQPRYREVYRRIKDAIVAGTYQHGSRIPSIRTLASELGLSRATIERAYDLLIGEGLLISNGQSGTSVSYIPPRHPSPRTAPLARTDARAIAADPRHRSSEARYPPASAALRSYAQAGVRPFQIDIPALDGFPHATWLKIANRFLKDRAIVSALALDIQGEQTLRDAICAHLSLARGIRCDPSQIFITTGYRQSLSLVCNACMSHDDQVWVEDPAQRATYAVLDQYGRSAVPIPLDSEGLDVDRARQKAPAARMAVTTAARQHPLGMPMSLRRRAALIQWAADTESWIVEDDHDSEFGFDGKQMPSLMHLDQNGRTFHLGSFSTVLHPNLRLAYVVSPLAALPEMRATAQNMIDGVPLVHQRVLAAFMAEGHFALHLKRLRRLYAERRAMLINALTATFGSRLVLDPGSRGLQLLITIDTSASDVEICAAAADRGLALSSLSSCYVEAAPRFGLLLGFANFMTAEQAARSIDALSDCCDMLAAR